MKRAPWIIAIQDISGFDRCSTMVVLPVSAAMGGECCPLLTARLSAHTAFPANGKATFLDLTGQMAGTAARQVELRVTFGAIYSGFLGSAGQIGLIEDFYRQLRREGTPVLVDPVMGDHGKSYHTYTPELCGRIRDLTTQTDVITPNLIEAALLLEGDYADLPRNEEGLWTWLKRPSLGGRRSVVLTGVSPRPGAIGVGYFGRAAGHIRFAMTRQEPAQFPGTGDLFAGVVLGAMLRGEPLETAAQRAAEFVQRRAAHALALGTPALEGVQFEPLLGEPMQR